MNEVMTIQEVSEYLKIPLSTMYYLAQKGKVPCRKVGKHWRFRKSVLDKWLEGSPK